MPRRGENIRKRADGRWEGRYKVSNSNKKTCYKSVYGKSYTEVKHKLKEAEHNENVSEKEPKQTGDTKASVCAEAWLASVRNRCKYSTYIRYQYIYEGHLKRHLEGMNRSQITREWCDTLLIDEYGGCSGRKLSMNSMKGIQYVLNQILKYGETGISCAVPDIVLADKKFDRNETVVLKLEEQEKLITYLAESIDSYKAGILLCLFSGLRLGELCALKAENVNLQKKTVKVLETVQRIKCEDGPHTMLYCSPPKSPGSVRQIPLSDEMVSILGQINFRGKYMVNGDRPMEPRTYQYKFHKYLKDAGLSERNFHSLRHTFATNCIAHGMDVKCLSEILGHSDVKTTMNKYVHPSMDTKRIQMNQCVPFMVSRVVSRS